MTTYGEMTTPALLDEIVQDDTAAAREIELADRLTCSIVEINSLLADLARLEAALGYDT